MQLLLETGASLLNIFVAEKSVLYRMVEVVRKKWRAVSFNDKVLGFYKPRVLFFESPG